MQPSAQLLRKYNASLSIESSYICKSIHLFCNIPAMLSCLDIFQRDATVCSYPFLNCLVPAFAAGKKDAKAVGSFVNSLKMCDVNIIVGKKQTVA